MPIRPATVDDADAIASIYNDAIVSTTAILWHTPKPATLWRDRMTDRPACYPMLVATDRRDAVQGFAMLGPYDDKCGYAGVAEWSVYVASASRGLGIGRALGESLLTDARCHGTLHTIVSRVTEGNSASEKLHRQLGFAEVGTFRQLGEKFGKRHDVVAYQLAL